MMSHELSSIGRHLYYYAGDRGSNSGHATQFTLRIWNIKPLGYLTKEKTYLK
jgi:hypothetical protein